MEILSNAEISSVLKTAYLADNPPIIVVQEWEYTVTPASLENTEWLSELPLLAEIVIPTADSEQVYMRTEHGWVNFLDEIEGVK